MLLATSRANREDGPLESGSARVDGDELGNEGSACACSSERGCARRQCPHNIARTVASSSSPQGRVHASSGVPPRRLNRRFGWRTVMIDVLFCGRRGRELPSLVQADASASARRQDTRRIRCGGVLGGSCRRTSRPLSTQWTDSHGRSRSRRVRPRRGGFAADRTDPAIPGRLSTIAPWSSRGWQNAPMVLISRSDRTVPITVRRARRFPRRPCSTSSYPSTCRWCFVAGGRFPECGVSGISPARGTTSGHRGIPCSPMVLPLLRR